jgi:hypothetical protein
LTQVWVRVEHGLQNGSARLIYQTPQLISKPEETQKFLFPVVSNEYDDVAPPRLLLASCCCPASYLFLGCNRSDLREVKKEERSEDTSFDTTPSS